ncbi:MAG: endopeptidase La [bacterium]
MKENILSLPAIAVRGLVPIPNNDLRIDVGRALSLNALKVSEKDHDFNIVIMLQKDPLIEDVTPEDLYDIGVLARVTLKLKIPNNQLRVKFNLLQKVKILEVTQDEPYFEVNYEHVEDRNEEDSETLTLVKMLCDELFKNPSLYLNNHDDIMKKIESGVSSSLLCDYVSHNLRQSNNRLQYLLEDNLNVRLTSILTDIRKEKDMQLLENKINEAVKKSIDESQKEYYLREKMKAIQNELGDKAKKEEDIDKMREKITESKMPKAMMDKALVELRRYQDTPSQSADSQILKNYLDFIIELPWHLESIDNQDLASVIEELNKNHHALDKVKDRIVEYLAVKIMTNKTPQTILCLVGPPGVGKTSLATSIATALNRKFVKIALGGVKDESEIRGHRRTYIGALPGRILNSMHKAKTVNPVILLDEIDKMASDIKGDPASAMLEVLDPEQNHTFSDHYMEEPYDLSKVLFITTANYLQNIPAPLRDRMEIVELSSYTKFEKFNIAKTHLVDRQLIAHGLDEDKFSITDEAIQLLVSGYTAEAGVRELNRQIGSLVRKTIKEILLNKVEKVEITVDNVEKFLGNVKYTDSSVNKTDKVGVVTGLAYTSFGGSALEIEVTHYSGKGGLVLTGKLGDVMKESAQTALSYVKSQANELNIDPKFFETHDIHVHVPEGAVPKDGPSAGVTLTSAIASAVTKRAAKASIGMTGEVTLSGRVLPIGGLREKSIAAHQQGIKTIIIPKDNEKDITDIPKEVLETLEIICVSHVDEVLAKILV